MQRLSTERLEVLEVARPPAPVRVADRVWQNACRWGPTPRTHSFCGEAGDCYRDGAVFRLAEGKEWGS